MALPSVAIFTLVSAGYDGAPLGNPYVVSAFTGLRAALVGIIAATLVRGWRRSLPDFKSHVYMVLALTALFLGVPVWQVVLVAVDSIFREWIWEIFSAIFSEISSAVVLADQVITDHRKVQISA